MDCEFLTVPGCCNWNVKKEWAAAQCGHAEIARAVALGEFLQPDGPEPRRAKRISKVQSCGRERGAEQINGISYYILGYPAIILYPCLLNVTNFFKEANQLKGTAWRSSGACQWTNITVRCWAAVHHGHLMPHIWCSLMPRSKKLLAASHNQPMMIMHDYASCKLNFGGHTFWRKGIILGIFRYVPGADLLAAARISLAEWRKAVKLSALAHSKPPVSAKQRSLDPLGHIWSISNMTKWPKVMSCGCDLVQFRLIKTGLCTSGRNSTSSSQGLRHWHVVREIKITWRCLLRII